MKKSLLSFLRSNPKLLNSIILLTCWSQIHAHANSYYFNRHESVTPIIEIDDTSENKTFDVTDQNPTIESRNKRELSEVSTAKNFNKSNLKANTKILASTFGNTILSESNSGEIRDYISDIKEGVIGTSLEHPIDQIYDNIFKISVDEKINPAYQYTLEYDLYGVNSYKEVSKVINDDLAVGLGGKNIQKNTIWTHQSEPIAEQPIKQGKNTVIFTLPYLSDYSYKVRNLRISISNKKQKFESIHEEKYNALSASKFVGNINDSEKLILSSAELNILKGTVKSAENFSITALRDIDMPALTPEMVNVTSENAGYRFLPHGEHFSAPAKVALGYNKSKIPTGYTEQDIKTFYFDKAEKKWIALDKDSINWKQNIVVSNTTHFTDMINGVLKVPESPETGSYAPNSIKDIKAANPSEGIVSIAPPSPNSMGSVTTSFPIKLPAGRAGMQPSLSVSYNSEGGNGWLGLGWDLSIPAVTIDTRWGVPTYNTGKETELYTLGGEQLAFEVSSGVFAMPNRNEGFDKGRLSDRQFYPRIEGSYNKIIRKGTNPKDYVWVVTSKDGTKSYFGGDDSGVKENAVLKDVNGNIGYWALYKTVDTNKNYVKYIYDNSVYTDNPGNGGQQIYPLQINYTLNETNNPSKNYKVTFETALKDDVQIDGRLGFLKIVAKKLSKIGVSYGDTNVRSYQFSYIEGVFKKQLLKNIKELDASDSDFYTNEIEYENLDTEVFGPVQNWSVEDNANVSGQGYSMLSGSSSESLGTNFGISIGTYTVPNIPTADQSLFSFRKGTFGAHGSVSNNKSNIKVTLLDIDGDNLPDRVYESGGLIYFSKNLSVPGGQQKFGASIPVSGNTSELGKTKVLAWGVGIDGNFGNTSLGFDYSNSTSTTSSYFMDFNSDGLVDFVKDGKVFFNRIVSGVPSFYPDSNGSPSPIYIATSSTQQSLFDSQDQTEKKMMLEQNPLHDVVRVWVAPKSGTITVKNSFKLNQIICPNNEDCSKADGVSVSFQHKNNNPLVANINAGDFSAYTFADQVININKGEKLYFRITSKYDGTMDQVAWNPEITYSVLNAPNQDSDNRNLSVYKAQEDFVNSNGSAYYTGEAGSLNLYLNKPIPLSDNADIILKVNDVIIPLPTISSASSYNNAIIGSPVLLNAKDKVTIKVNTDTQIDWSRFKLIPEFTGISGQKAYIQVEYTMYNDRGNFSTYSANSSDVGKKILVKASSLPNFNNRNGKIVISAKTKNRLLTKTTYQIVNGNNTVITTFGNPYILTTNDVAAGNNQIYLETTVSSDDRDFINNITTINGVLVNSNLNYINNPGNLSLQIPNTNNTSHSDGTIVIGQSTTLYFVLQNYAPNTSATLSITDTSTGNGVNFQNGTLSGQPGLSTSTSVNLGPGVYTYNLNFFQGSNTNANTKIYITNGGTETNLTSFVNTPPHKPILAPLSPTAALNSNQYDERFGILYRGWGGFVLNGNNNTKNTVVEAYDLNKNYANSGTVVEMKIDETRLALSNSYGTNPGTNPPVNVPQVDPNGNVIFPDNNSSLSKNYFLMLNSNINNVDKGRLTDVDPTIYMSQQLVNASRLGIHSVDTAFDNYSISQSPGDQLNAPSIKMKNQSISVAGGVSIGGVVGINSSHTIFSKGQSIRNVLDYNGDGFPDDFNKKSIKLTTSIGGPSNAGQDSFSLNHYQSVSSASTQGLSTGYSFSHGESSRMAFIRTVGSKNKDKFNNVEKAIKGSHESQKGSTKLSISGNAEQSDEKSEETFLDINGDGLPDLYDNGNFSLSVGRNNFANNASWNTGEASKGTGLTTGLGGGISLFWGSFEGGINTSTTESDTKEELIDINGDGLPDKVTYTGSIAKVYINKGKGIENSPLSDITATSNFHTDQSKSIGGNVAGTILIPIPTNPTATTGLKLNISIGVSTGKSTSKTKSTFKDMNGDGYPDFVTSDNENNIKVRLNQIGTTNLLKKVTTPMGGSWEVAYERVGNTYDMPQSKYVLKSVITNDGFAGDNAYSPDVSKVTASYEKPFHSRRERTFYGFEKLTVNQIDTKQGGASSNVVYRKTIQIFNNSNYYLKGALLNEKLLDANDKVWTEKNNTYSLRKIKNVDLTETLFIGEAEKNAVNYACFAVLTGTDSKFYEGVLTTNKSTSTLFKKFDQWGNATEVEDKGDIDIGASELLTSKIVYTLVNPTAYIVMPTSVKNTANGVTREKKAVYNPANGNLTSMTILNQGANYSVYEFEYNTYGNITKSTGPANSQGQKFFHQYTYDDNVKTYPVKVQDAFGYTSKTQYDFRFGVPTLTEDMNLQPMEYKYDDKARTVEIRGPYEMFNNIPWTIKFEYNPITNAPQNSTNAQSFATTKHYDPEIAGNTINTITIADGFGGAVQVKKTGDIHNEGIKYIVAGKVEQDAFGRALKTYYPTVEAVGSSNTLYNAAVDNIEPTINQYDVLDRVVYSKLPGENLFSTISYGFGSDVQGRNMFQTIFKDELGSIKKTYTDIKGRTTSVHEVSNTGDIKTKFTHDAIGEILQVQDVQGNITTSVYDDLGRRTSYTHPDSGVTTFVYDTASNMTSKTNAANEIVEYKYDYTRLKAVNYPVYPENNVKYYYGNALDASAMDNNAVGRLWYQTDATGTQYLKYGRLGELTYQRRSVAVPSSGVFWFATEWQYDTWNRVKTITYPDGEKLTYQYNKAGNLNNITSVKDGFTYEMIRQFGYDKFEQRVYLMNGNDTETTYEYETNRRRLLKMYAKNTNGNRYFMQNTYQYDAVSNVMQIHNNAPVVSGFLGGGANYAYGYDDLYRLTSASGNWRGVNTQDQEERHRYTVAMSYDNMHNVTSKTQKHEWTDGPINNNWTALEPTSYRLNYKYENASHPHAPSKIIDEPNLVPSSTCCNPDDPGVKFQHYQYDAKGNPTKILQETCNFTEEKTTYLWDEENRLRFVDTNPSTPESDGATIYTYDAGGERIIKDVLSSGYLIRTIGEQSNTGPMLTLHNVSMYPNGLVTINYFFDNIAVLSRYTKHYYAGSQRIVSKIGTNQNIGTFNCNWLIIPFGGTTAPINPVTASNNILQTATQSNLSVMQLNSITPPPNYGQNAGYSGNCVSNYSGDKETEIYWFHSDHLGSSSYITGRDGEVTQNIEYFPSGEVFVENHNIKSNNSPYKFNGKELDAETGYYYYGARYYNPRVSLWLNVDPLNESYLLYQDYPDILNSKTLNSYGYTYQNPIKYTDYEGALPIPVITGLIGGAINVGINIWVQSKEGNLDFSSGKTWSRIGLAAGSGFIAGATGHVEVAMAANGLGNLGDQLISNGGDFKKVNYTAVGVSAALGGASTKMGQALVKSRVINGVVYPIADRLTRNAAISSTSRYTATLYEKTGETVASRLISRSTNVLGSVTSNSTIGIVGTKNVPDYFRNWYDSSTRWIYNKKLRKYQKQTISVGVLRGRAIGDNE